jgi:hypothetical protein
MPQSCNGVDGGGGNKVMKCIVRIVSNAQFGNNEKEKEE